MLITFPLLQAWRTANNSSTAPAPKPKPTTTRHLSGATLRAALLLSAMAAPGLSAQSALGTPFIRDNVLAFRSTQIGATGASALTTTYGAVYAHRYGNLERATRPFLTLRTSARSLEAGTVGILEAGVALGMEHQVRGVRGLSLAASLGASAVGWGDDAADTGRLLTQVPVTLGVSQDLSLGSATVAPFILGSAGRYAIRTSLHDVVQSRESGWDASYAVGASFRLREVVLTSTRFIGEQGFAHKNRWSFLAGVSF
jgi:hypothetical protein